MKKRYFYVAYEATVNGLSFKNSIYFAIPCFFNIHDLMKSTSIIDCKNNQEYEKFNILFFYEFSADDYLSFIEKHEN